MLLYFLHGLVSSFITIIVLFYCRKDKSLAKKLTEFWSLGVCWHYWSLFVEQMGVTLQKAVGMVKDNRCQETIWDRKTNITLIVSTEQQKIQGTQNTQYTQTEVSLYLIQAKGLVRVT